MSSDTISSISISVDSRLDDNDDSVVAINVTQQFAHSQQSIITVNNYLPYQIDYQQEPVEYLTDIKYHLQQSIQQAEFTTTAFWTRQLRSYLELKYPLIKQDKLILADLYYRLMINDGMDMSLYDTFVSMACRLLKKEHEFGPHDFQWDWRPLYRLIKRTLFPPQRRRVLPGQSVDASQLIRFIHKARNYFTRESTDEILAELLPEICADSLTHSLTAVTLLATFLPTNDNQRPVYWVEDCFNQWTLLSPLHTWDSNFMDLFSRLACDQYGMQTVRFTDSQMRFVFEMALRWMEFPIGTGLSKNESGALAVGSKTNPLSSGVIACGGSVRYADETIGNSPLMKKRADGFKVLARFIIYTIYPAQASQVDGFAYVDTLALLRTLLQSIESFYHPSNSGRWTAPIVRFLQYLCETLHERLISESPTAVPSVKCKYDSRYFLDAAGRKDLVLAIRPLLFLSMFGKSQTALKSSHSALKTLAWIEPSLIFPELLERIYPSLETLTETHRTSAAISALARVAIPMINRRNYPEGATNLIPLLELTLPGIDMNDPGKTISTLLFYSKVFVCVPIGEIPDSAVDDDTGSGEALRSFNEICVEQSRAFEDWLSEFFNRVFLIFENLPQEGEHGHESQETNLVQIMLFTCEILFMQLSPSLLSFATTKIVKFLQTHVIPNATKQFSLLVMTLCSSASDCAISEILPICQQKIAGELEHGAGAKPSASSSHAKASLTMAQVTHGSETTLVWYLHIFIGICMSAGCLPDFAQRHHSTVVAIVRQVWDRCESRETYRLAGKALKHLIKAYGMPYLSECRSQSGKWDPEHLARALNQWGMSPSELSAPINPVWHLPSANEKSAIIELYRLFAEPELNVVEQLMQNAVAKMAVDKESSSSTTAGAEVDENSESWKELGLKFCKSLLMLCQFTKAFPCLLGDEMASRFNRNTDGMKMDINAQTGNDDDDDSNSEDGKESEGRESDAENDLEKNLVKISKRRVRLAYCFNDATGDSESVRYLLNWHKRLGELLSELLVFFLTHREDDNESIKLILQLVDVYLNNRGMDSEKYDMNMRAYRYTKSLMSPGIKNGTKDYPRFLMLRRIGLQEMLRAKHNSASIPKTGGLVESRLAENLLASVLQLSTGTYAETRETADDILTYSLKHYPYCKRFLLDQVFKVLKQSLGRLEHLAAEASDKDSVELLAHNQIKGCLTLLRSSIFMHMCLRQWHYMSLLANSLVRAMDVDETEIQDLIRDTFREFFLSFGDQPFITPCPPELFKAADALYSGAVSPVVPSDVQQRLERREVFRRQHHRQLISDLLTFSEKSKHWRLDLLISNFLELLNREDVPPRADLLQFYAGNMVNEILPIRMVALTSFSRTLYYVKKQSTEAKPPTYLQTVPSTELLLSHRNGLTRASLQQSNESEWNESRFIDKLNWGWWSWPRQVKLYRANQDSPQSLFMNRPDCGEAYAALRSIVRSAEFWQSFLRYCSQESSSYSRQSDGPSAPEEVFSLSAVRLYKAVFQLFEDEFLYELFAPTVEKWFACSEDKSQQRASAEFFAGIIQASKHWRWPALEKLWNWLIPLVKRALLNCTPETMTFWYHAIRYACIKRDPKRLTPLLRLLFTDPDFLFDPKSDSSFSEAKKIYFLRTICTMFNWHLRDQSLPLLKRTVQQLNNPYKQVREILGGILWDSSAPMRVWPAREDVRVGRLQTIDEWLARAKLSDNRPLRPYWSGWYQMDEETLSCVDEAIQTVRSFRAKLLKSMEMASSSLSSRSAIPGVGASEAPSPTSTQKPQTYGSDYSNAAKTVLRWILEGFSSSRPHSILPLLFSRPASEKQSSSFLTDLFLMQVTDDPDLDLTASTILSLLPDYFYPVEQAAETVWRFVDVFERELMAIGNGEEEMIRRVKLKGLAFLQVLFFRHLFFVLNNRRDGVDCAIHIMDLVTNLLRDNMVEVRQLAGITLSGLVRCCGGDGQEHQLITLLKARFMQWSETRIIKGDQATLSTRHAGILGLSALISAFPYEIPDWIPDVLVHLSRHISDPGPLAGTVRATFSEFRRTHQDTWQRDVLGGASSDYSEFYGYAPTGTETGRGKSVFTAEHLEALEGLLTSTANYYA